MKGRGSSQASAPAVLPLSQCDLGQELLGASVSLPAKWVLVERWGNDVGTSTTDSCEGPVHSNLRGGGLEGLGWRASKFFTPDFPLLCPQPSEFEEEASQKVDDLLESYMGIRDPELGKGPG